MTRNSDYIVLDTDHAKNKVTFKILTGVYADAIIETSNFEFGDAEDLIHFNISSLHPDIEQDQFKTTVAIMFYSFLKEGLNQIL